MTRRAAAVAVALALVVVGVVGRFSPAGAGQNDGPGGTGTIGSGGVSVSVSIGGPGGGGPGGGPPLVGTWTNTFLGLCTSTGGIIIFIPFILPIPILPVPIGDVSGQIQGLVIHHTLISPDGQVLLEYTENECDPASPPPPVAPPTFAAVAAAILLPAPDPVTSPRVDGLVGLENWFWWQDVHGSQQMTYGISTPALDGRWVASGTATLIGLDWDLGNGKHVSAGASSLPGSEQQPAASYTYQYDGTYPIVVTATWHIAVTLTDTALGTSTPLVAGDTTTQSPVRQYEVRQVQAVGTNH
jgi:hypothetical protein